MRKKLKVEFDLSYEIDDNDDVIQGEFTFNIKDRKGRELKNFDDTIDTVIILSIMLDNYLEEMLGDSEDEFTEENDSQQIIPDARLN